MGAICTCRNYLLSTYNKGSHSLSHDAYVVTLNDTSVTTHLTSHTFADVRDQR